MQLNTTQRTSAWCSGACTPLPMGLSRPLGFNACMAPLLSSPQRSNVEARPNKLRGSRLRLEVRRPQTALAATAANLGSAPSGGQDKGGVVIVGGGPAGCAAALMLARRGWEDITLVEQQADPTYADPDRSYVYCIDGRGRKFLDPAGLTPALQDASVSTVLLTVNRVGPDGRVRASNMSVKDPNRATYWVPRSALMKLLVKGLQDDPAAQKAVRVASSTRAAELSRDSSGRIGVSLEPTAHDNQGTATSNGSGLAGRPTMAAAAASLAPAETPGYDVADGSSPKEVLHPRLLLACDGYRSKVRDALADWCPGQYQSITFPSLSTGLRYKVLRLPANPATKAGDVLPNPAIVVLEGQPCKRLAGGNPLRLGLLPVRDPQAPRTANLNLLPDHPLWDITDGEEMYQVLDESFPQMNWRALVPSEVMNRFAASRGGTFPAPQYTTGLSWTPEQVKGTSPAGGTSVVLLGDAAHSFPPDLGQGVNSALEDIMVLDKALEECGDDPAAAARLYNNQRLADAEALAKLMQVGAPLQYKQYKLQEKLFIVGFVVQLLLSKVLPWFVQPPIAMLIQDPTLSYSNIWSGAEQSTAVMRALGGAAIVVLIVAAGYRLLRVGVAA